MKNITFILLAALQLSLPVCQADEPEWLERDALAARIPENKSPAILGFGLMQDGKFSNPGTGKPLEARFSSTKYWHQYAHPLSMGRLQMSIWFFIIIASFVFLWCATGSIAGVSSTSFILMGISGGTTAVSCFISSKQEWDARVRSAASPNRSRLANWVIDLLSDEHGPTIHRFQMLAWTLVLGVVFVHDVITDYAMPVFSNEVMGLMGISSGVYVGFKMKEGAPAAETKPGDDA
jgi:hypothetical protein